MHQQLFTGPGELHRDTPQQAVNIIHMVYSCHIEQRQRTERSSLISSMAVSV